MIFLFMLCVLITIAFFGLPALVFCAVVYAISKAILKASENHIAYHEVDDDVKARRDKHLANRRQAERDRQVKGQSWWS
jgi:hypothetical protein